MDLVFWDQWDQSFRGPSLFLGLVAHHNRFLARVYFTPTQILETHWYWGTPVYNAIYTPCVEDQPDCILHQAVSGVPNPLQLIAWPINVGMWMSKNSNKIQKTPSYPTSAQPVLPTSFHRKLAGSLTASGLVARGTFIPDVRPNFRKSTGKISPASPASCSASQQKAKTFSRLAAPARNHGHMATVATRVIDKPPVFSWCLPLRNEMIVMMCHGWLPAVLSLIVGEERQNFSQMFFKDILGLLSISWSESCREGIERFPDHSSVLSALQVIKPCNGHWNWTWAMFFSWN